jgi:hypothetical protein
MPREFTTATGHDIWRREANVHLFVHSPGAIHTTVQLSTETALDAFLMDAGREMIYIPLVPQISGDISNSSAADTPMCEIIFVGQWNNTRAFLFGLRLQSSARWTCWRVIEIQPGVKLCEKQLSCTLQHDSNLLKPKMPLDIDEYLLGGFLNPCW